MPKNTDADFLLESETAKVLFHGYAEQMPIIDFHCHINPAEIFENKRFGDISEAWLGGDHYKWRLMRACGVGEEFVTGSATGWEKFKAFAEALPRAVGNPVYHWVHLELQRYFGCSITLCPDTAREIWDACNKKLAQDESLRVRGIIETSQVRCVITTDDPADDLAWHRKLAEDKTFGVKVLPGWRPDAVMNIGSPGFLGYISKLGAASGIKIADFESLKAALVDRMEYFSANGCVACDHGILKIDVLSDCAGEADALLKKRLSGGSLSAEEAEWFRQTLLHFCAREYARLGWVMQLHLGALRNVNTVMYGKLGADTGFDSIGSSDSLSGLARFLDSLNTEGALPKTLIFSIDQSDNMAINTLAGCFQQEGVKGKVQQGAAWWFNDSLLGIERQLTDFAECGVLANFAGMLTDSRSFLSYTRHEYFRRVLCGLIGRWADAGLCTPDIEYLGGIVRDISFNNAREFFGV